MGQRRSVAARATSSSAHSCHAPSRRRGTRRGATCPTRSTRSTCTSSRRRGGSTTPSGRTSVAKAIGVVTMASVVFPTYLLARTLVSRRWALFAAAGAATIPALAYSSMLLEEPLAYPWAALCFFLLAKALATRRPAWIVGAALACLVAPWVRGQLAVIIGGAVLATAAFWFVGRRRAPFAPQLDGAGTGSASSCSASCALSVLSVIASHRWGIWQIVDAVPQGRDDQGRVLGGGLADDRPRRPAHHRGRSPRSRSRATGPGRASNGRSRRSREACSSASSSTAP